MKTDIQDTHQVECDTYRLILSRRNGKEVLLTCTDGRLALPSFDVLRRQRLAESLTAAVKHQGRGDFVCLFNPNSSATRVRYQVMESCNGTAEPEHPDQWLPVSHLPVESFADPDDHRVLCQALAEWEDPAAAGPFLRSGWFAELRHWVDKVIRPLGLKLTGPFCQYNASPSFSLMRFETDGPAVWFKAVGEPNLREFPLTQALAKLLPAYVPEILATRPEWNGWLMLEAEGTNLSEVQDRERWQLAARALAKLQIDSIGNHAELLNVGARDLRVSILSNLLQPFFELMVQLMSEQTKPTPAALTREELALLEKQIRYALVIVWNLGMPETIGHLDLNPGNVVISRDDCKFLDWSEGHVGHPFFSFEYLLEHFRRNFPGDASLEAEFAEAYAEPWRALFPDDTVMDSLALAPMLAVSTYALGSDAWKAPYKLSQRGAAGYLRSLTRRMKSEADKLAERRFLCRS